MATSPVLAFALLLGAAMATMAYASDGCPVCKPGEKKQIDCCNTCTCVGPGVWACTLMACPHIKEVKTNCKPNITFKNDCNNCTCNAEGTKACCTTRNCSLPWPGHPVCIPGEKKWQDCNECHCVGGKRWLCTERLCPKENGD
ncbi:serine protease inhibitor I/II-like [Schistocerca nitens]|uniref:serine protease inhibitor I/II-like n=1 Tax=Schistocerca nitens TaxID=7011 RepID=UPI002118F9ED|nr:serine protease inhibitor I/II-like [Schistocerca nitens]